MDYDKIKYAIYLIYEKYAINRLPFDCIGLLETMGFSCKKYSHLSESKYEACLRLSEDACTLGNEIFYNDKKSKRRIRFSLMHELGHLALDSQDEAEANNFASTILAPSMAVYYSKLSNIREISNIFNISLECAKYAYETCEKWVYSVKHYGMTDVDWKIYNHFYDEEVRKFVFKITPCAYCDTLIYNSNKPLCECCDKPVSNISRFDRQRIDFINAENSWLYGGI
ncbi:ImmA/IrrE family metallo-endopeptidase [Anaerocolumna sedimenticola]|uniref:ImmA/IrrE family metallo-endopeptidase n=1 Tax=Anaerocolumna sedimenticola TaxID=2696063 RepID=A0A6P1TPN4_9FIRM|nr:ImmA/IrrE family metallo-endopeptidase [Anaerocolumna sedimenticola]QHQ61358.1 ImmA/IrrE family metallo-endopeptidase [Anaerocolumna sedimenticola]